MVKLINGRGQLGDQLSLIEWPDDVEGFIYHTWNIDNSSEEIQSEEYKKFVRFVDAHKDDKIYFISTKQGKQKNYLHYKLKSELYLIENCRSGHIIRIPKIIGKGICASFREGLLIPFLEEEEIITARDAAAAILDKMRDDSVINIVKGSILDKWMIYNLIQYGVNGES
jgi:hypothetical protein